MPARRRLTLTRRQAMQVAIEAGVDPRTVQRWAGGDTTIRETTDLHIQRAVAKLGLKEGA